MIYSRFFQILSFLGLLTLMSCSSAPKKTIDYNHAQEPIIHEAVCYIDHKVFQEKNLKLVDIVDRTYILEAEDGKKLALPTDECILKSTDSTTWKSNLEEKGFRNLDQERWVKCELGPVSMMADELVYVADEKAFLRMRTKFGVDWSLPRPWCKSYPMMKRE